MYVIIMVLLSLKLFRANLFLVIVLEMEGVDQ